MLFLHFFLINNMGKNKKVILIFNFDTLFMTGVQHLIKRNILWNIIIQFRFRFGIKIARNSFLFPNIMLFSPV